MIPLPDLTLLAMDTLAPEMTVKAMKYSMLDIEFAEAVLITSKQLFRSPMLASIGGQGRLDTIKPHFLLKHQGPRIDYELAVICDLHPHFSTSHCLFIEWDAGVINPEAWNPEWLEYDFIGAPWPYNFNEIGYPPCVRENCVGNGGFSLRSRKFCEATAAVHESRKDKSPARLSDAYICRTLRPDLESMGIKFATPEVAAMFSCENRIYSGQFGFHGKNTIKMNGWNWALDWLI